MKNNKYTFTLTGSAADVRKLAKTLIDARLGDCNMAVGAELTYEGEQILKGNVSEFLDYDGDNLAAVLIANPYGGENAVTHGMNDEEIPGKISVFTRSGSPLFFILSRIVKINFFAPL